MTGIASRIIHSGRFFDCLNAVDDLQALDGLLALLALAVADHVAQLLGELVEVELREQVLDGLGAHAAAEVVAVAQLHLAVERLVVDERLDRELRERVEGLLEERLAIGVLLLDVLDVAVGFLVDLLDAVLGRDVSSSTSSPSSGSASPRGDRDQAVALGLDLFELLGLLGVELLEVGGRARP